MIDFRNQYCNEIPAPSERQLLFEAAWREYDNAADAIDGHIKRPISHEEHSLVLKAGCAGREAMEKFLRIHGIYEYCYHKDLDYQWAKMRRFQ